MGSSMAGLMFIWAMFNRYFPHHLQPPISKLWDRVLRFFYPHIQIRFHEHSRDSFRRNEAYSAIESYLGSKSTNQAKHLKANAQRNSKSVVLTMEDHEEVSDQYHGVNLVWSLIKLVPSTNSISFYPSTEKRYYKLTFHARHREIITGPYLKHVMEEGQAISFKNRQRKLYTNGSGQSRTALWSHVAFEHPGSFETMAMEERRKEELMEDLITFSQAREYYARIGKAWKRGYLLYGPPGTGKSSMIAAIENFLKYDVYDLELTAVKGNTELRKLLIETSSKSMIVIEDIDCSLDPTGQRKKKESSSDHHLLKEEAEDEEDDERHSSKATLSELLIFIDGIWSSSAGERIIVFTTNHVEKLDPALIRRGRMDKHIELSYCSFEAFRVLAKNYLNLDSHPMFETTGGLLREVRMTPADVAESLMPKKLRGEAETCLESLTLALEAAKKEGLGSSPSTNKEI